MADSGAATSHAEGADNGNTGAASKAREAASAPASRSICLRRVISRPAAGVTGTAVPVAPTVPAAPAAPVAGAPQEGAANKQVDEKKKAAEEKKSEEQAAAGLGSLFG